MGSGVISMVLLTKVWDEDRKSHRIPIQYVINELEIARASQCKLVMFTNPYNPFVVRVDLVDPQTEEGEEFAWVERLTPKTEALLLAIADKHEHGRFW
jgi:hypothetical protein